MTSDEAPERPEGVRGYVRFSARLARAICLRIAAGESQLAISADPAMPSRATLGRWARERPAFGRILTRAKALGNHAGKGRPSTFHPVVAHEIAARLSEGESLTAISRDPAMPSLGTIFYWRKSNPEFAESLRLAREAVAERFCDLGWQMAMEATPETAHLTRVRLAQLRWTAAILSPRTHGRLKASEPPEPREEMTVLLRTVKLETHPQTGQQRVVGYCPNPHTMRPMRDSEGPWKDPPEVIRQKFAGFEAAGGRPAPPNSPNDPDDPEGWR